MVSHKTDTYQRAKNLCIFVPFKIVMDKRYQTFYQPELLHTRCGERKPLPLLHLTTSRIWTMVLLMGGHLNIWQNSC